MHLRENSQTEKLVADSLFLLQVVGAILFSGAYVLRAIHDVTGSSIVQFGLVALFLAFHLMLSVGAHKTKPSRLTRQAIGTYILWLVLYVAVIVATASNTKYRWTPRETTTLLCSMWLIIVVVILTRILRQPISSPMTKALLAIAFKSIPQVFLAWKFLVEGASGTPTTAIVVGHITILTRLGQIYYLVREAGWDKNRLWLAISELCNEATWTIVSVVWLTTH